MIKPTEGNIEMKEQNGVLWGASSLDLQGPVETLQLTEEKN